MVEQLRWVAVCAVVIAIVWPLILFEEFHAGAFLGIFLAVWIIGATVKDTLNKTANREGRLTGFLRLRRSFIGMSMGHIGFACAILGVTLVSIESQELDIRMTPGEKVQVLDYEFEFMGLAPYKGANYNANRATIRVTSATSDEVVAMLYPEKRIYLSKGSPMTEAGIDAGLFRDLYIALGEKLDGEAWAVRIQIKPFVRWIWLGALIMALGGIVAISDQRYRKKHSILN